MYVDMIGTFTVFNLEDVVQYTDLRSIRAISAFHPRCNISCLKARYRMFDLLHTIKKLCPSSGHHSLFT